MDSKPSSLDNLICNDNTYAYTYDKKPAHYSLQTTGTDTSMNRLDHSLYWRKFLPSLFKLSSIIMHVVHGVDILDNTLRKIIKIQ
jgi:hypothetical protein